MQSNPFSCTRSEACSTNSTFFLFTLLVSLTALLAGTLFLAPPQAIAEEEMSEEELLALVSTLEQEELNQDEADQNTDADAESSAEEQSDSNKIAPRTLDSEVKRPQPVPYTSTRQGGNKISSVLGMDPGKYFNWLYSHENDNYYIGTPYYHGDHRNPNGDCAYAYGKYDSPGHPGMNCTGFVWHALAIPTGQSGGSK